MNFDGKRPDFVQLDPMSTNAPPDRFALLTAEEVLRTIYGDDLKGCPVSLEQIAAVIGETGKLKETQTRELLRLYEKVVEAVSVLSTPPDRNAVSDPGELQSILSQRLDAIYTVARKTMEMTALVQKPPADG
jgi:hypothetical protein